MARKAKRKPQRPALPAGKAALHSQQIRQYTGKALQEISFPLGGIGTGTIGLGGRGQLRDWEIYNNPNLHYRPAYSMPWLFCKKGKDTFARIVERRLLPPHFSPGGLRPAELPGLPRFAEAVFHGTYPTARIEFQDDELPLAVELEAFNPMTPGDAETSAIPAAILTYRLTNTSRSNLSGTLAFSTANSVDQARGKPEVFLNKVRQAKGLAGLEFTGEKYENPDFAGSVALAVLGDRKATAVADMDESGWFDRGQKAWNHFSTKGEIRGTSRLRSTDAGDRGPFGMVGVNYRLKPGQTTEITFVIAWSFPRREGNYFCDRCAPAIVANHYAARFDSAWKAARYVAANLDDLRERTLRWQRALFDSTLPGAVLDAVSSQSAIVRSNTTMWLDEPADDKAGRVFAFEGCNADGGCCPMNCTHVWNYEQTLAHLYPSLEKTMRVTDYEYNLHHNGAMSFRTALPLNDPKRGNYGQETPAADGQFGTVVKVHREWRISGDNDLLARLWPEVKKTIRFAWKGRNKWDTDADGVMDGIQHNTYDIEFFGPNTMCGSLYLAALAAGVEMARAMGDTRAAKEFQAVYDSGTKKLDEMLFNGEYYEQKVQEVTKAHKTLTGLTLQPGRPKYQYGKGCLADQLLGQWTAHVAGLGYVLPAEHVRKAMDSIFRYNFKPDLTAHESCQRIYAINDEAGLANCTWPKGQREEYPFPYSDEFWTGIEYQVAAGLIFEGLIDEGLAVVYALRERHDGIARNPWNEFECGSFYARAMASWSVLLALAGQYYDGRSAALTVKPRVNAEDFCCVVTGFDAWGQFRQKATKTTLGIEVTGGEGKIKLKQLNIAWPGAAGRVPGRVEATLDGKALPATLTADGKDMTVTLSRTVGLDDDQTLAIKLR